MGLVWRPLAPRLKVPRFPKDHAEKLHEVPDEYFADVLPAAKQIALALNAENYNLLQVNDRYRDLLLRFAF